MGRPPVGAFPGRRRQPRQRQTASLTLPGMPWPSDVDPDRQLFGLLDDELRRQNTTLQLIASENFASPAVLQATGSVLTNKYSEGYPSKRYYGGNQVLDEVEELARQRAVQLFRAEH